LSDEPPGVSSTDELTIEEDDDEDNEGEPGTEFDLDVG
jgi:hypothetical protein